jgi:hypothetical protein
VTGIRLTVAVIASILVYAFLGGTHTWQHLAGIAAMFITYGLITYGQGEHHG